MEEPRSATHGVEDRINEQLPDRRGRGSRRGRAQGKHRGIGRRAAAHTDAAELQMEEGETVPMFSVPAVWDTLPHYSNPFRLNIMKKKAYKY